MELRRSHSLPIQEESGGSFAKDLRCSKSEDLVVASSSSRPVHDVDRYGPSEQHDAKPLDTRSQLRVKKWNTMLADWDNVRPRLLKRRLRKGVPTCTLRAQVWTKLTRASHRQEQNPGVYKTLVQNSLGNAEKNRESRMIQETIERDIHRTFPRHQLFLEAPQIDETDSLAKVALFMDQPPDHKSILEEQTGQASLRRILKAYSMYDQEVGYCQGMNFIAGLFLTVVQEETAFWMLVHVMNDAPCRMRTLFGEGMKDTHQVLFVADKLIHQFLPKLAKHLDKEMIHVTMYATQWLLTQYTSSFRFDMVTKLWDCFLCEGWKITYRVMLAILKANQSKLLALNFEEILAFFRELPNDTSGMLVLDSVKIPLRTAHIRKYEKEYQRQQQKNAMERSNGLANQKNGKHTSSTRTV